MAARFLARAGQSLAAVYQTVANQLRLDTLEEGPIATVHEMGGTVFSERLSAVIVRLDTGALIQSTEISTAAFAHGPSYSRIVGVQIISDDASRLIRVSLSLKTPSNAGVGPQEMPLFVWDQAATSSFEEIDLIDDGAGVAVFDLLRPMVLPGIPSMLVGPAQPFNVNQVIMRGLTSAFGAGNVTVIGLVYRVFPNEDITGRQPSSVGLPIPSW